MTDRLRPLVLFVLAILLSACSSHPSAPPLGELPRTPKATLQQLLAQAETAPAEQVAGFKLSAADLAARQGDLAQARRILEQVPLASLLPAQQIFACTLQAELAVATGRPDQALVAIQHPSFQRLAELPVEQQIRSHLARARTYETNQQQLEALRERVYLAPLLVKHPMAMENHDAIWALVSTLPADTTVPPGNVDLDGWLDLGRAMRQANTLVLQQAAIDQWRQKHSGHPAAKQLPTLLARLRELTDRPLTKVALILPMQGQLAAVATSIRDGFMAAHFQAQQNGQAISQVKLYDSTRITSMDTFYRDAQKEGVELVIGPLEKDWVRQLSGNPQLPIPTLALNYAEASQVATPPQLFQFGLAAEDEAREVARKAWADGHRRAVALVAAGDWGSRVLEAFRQAWLAQGGTLVAAEPIAEVSKLPAQIVELFRLRESEARAKRLVTQLGAQVSAQPTRRQDIDFLFLAAGPQQAQQVKPAMVFQYAGDVPVYGTSQLFAANGNRNQYLDLEGIRFTETPWLLNPATPLRAQMAGQWPQVSTGLGRLYAMGADAYLLASRLNQMQLLPETRLKGLSGVLSLNGQRRVERQLPWATFHNGEVVPVEPTP